jgi:hypothetical protein
MAINNINIGAIANDGTGDSIRDAFDTVNENFAFVQGGLFAGTEASILNALSITSGYIISNTYVLADTYVNANSLIGNTVTSYGNLFVSKDGAYIVGNVNIVGNLNVTGTQSASASQSTDAGMINIHYPLVPPLSSDDGKDIGVTFKYYKSAEVQTFLGWQNSTGTLVWLDNVTEAPGNVITAGTFGNVKFGQLSLSNTTVSTSNVTGALTVAGGIGVQGNVYVQSNVFVGNAANVGNLSVRGNVVGSVYFGGSDTVYINGSPVVTSATAFAGGTVPLATQFADSTQSTSTTSGAVTIIGGLGVAGNTNLANLSITNSGNVRANIQGNIFTSAQPYITSLGTLTDLNVAGQTVVRDIIPSINNTYQLGTSDTTRWSKIWAFDLDLSGTLTGGAVNATTLRATSNTQATSTSSGALRVTGGASLTNGNLYIGGSGGDAIVAVGNVSTNGNIVATGNLQVGSLRIGQTDFANNVSTNGYQQLPGGIIIQWGTDVVTTSNHNVNFPIVFPNAALSVTVSGQASGINFIPYNFNLTTSGYQQGFYSNSGSSGSATAWDGKFIAIGY